MKKKGGAEANTEIKAAQPPYGILPIQLDGVSLTVGPFPAVSLPSGPRKK